jgi:hypothetical protein
MRRPSHGIVAKNLRSRVAGFVEKRQGFVAVLEASEIFVTESFFDRIIRSWRSRISRAALQDSSSE